MNPIYILIVEILYLLTSCNGEPEKPFLNYLLFINFINSSWILCISEECLIDTAIKIMRFWQTNTSFQMVPALIVFVFGIKMNFGRPAPEK